MEGEVYEYLRKRIGCKGIDGMMTPSGSFANWNGMLLACYYKFPGSKTKIITSAASHYSVEKVQS
jgi:glutamate/tyrosine decarboxylase-like PLP-dependent enzyme